MRNSSGVYLAMVCLIGFIGWGLYQNISKENELEKYGNYVVGIITVYGPSKARRHVEYEFLVKDKLYSGHSGFNDRLSCEEGGCVGYECKIIYSERDPTINEFVELVEEEE